MKIAISAQGPSLDSLFEPRFGRTPGFVIYDSESQAIDYVDNKANQDLSQGAGIKTAQLVTEQGVEVLITGNIGPKAMQALSQTNLKILQVNAQTVKEALESSQTRQSDAQGTMSGFGPGSSTTNPRGGQGMGGGGQGRGPGQGGRGMGGGARGKGPGKGGRGMGGGRRKG